MFLFEEIFKDTIWGGDRIARLKGITLSRQDIGESWEISGLPGHETLVRCGPDKGKSLKDLAAEYGEDLLGSHVFERYGTDFPILVKFIDAHADLSIQVHPDDKLAQARHGCNGKTEMWYVVDAVDEGRLMVGFDHTMSATEYDKSLEKGDIADKIRSHQAKKGDVFFLPSGRIHAACTGVLLAEIQQSSDITYRIYDYGRKDNEGKLRELHTNEAREALDFTSHDDYRTHYTSNDEQPTTLAECEYFKTELLNIRHKTRLTLPSPDSFSIIICMEGEVKVSQKDGLSPGTALLKAGHTMLLPANATSVCLTPSTPSKLLQVAVP